MGRSGLVFVAVVGVAASGCLVDPYFPFDAGSSGPIDAGPPIEIPVDPLTATGTLDTARKVSGTFGWDAGGALTATAADGTVFTLEVPGTSLTADTEITLTPYATLDTGLGETNHGVKLEPEGLQATTTFMTLTITPPSGATWPTAQQVPFTLQGTRNVVSLSALDVKSAPVKLRIGHFSSYGLALAMKGFSASLEASRHRLGGDVEAQLETEVAAVLATERQSQLLGNSESNIWPLISDLAARYVAQVVKPRIAAAGQSCANARLAVQTVLGYERQMQLLGSEALSSLGFDWQDMFKLNVVCMKEEYELCRDNHILTRVIPSFIGILRQQQLLGLGEDSKLNPSRYECEQYLGKCLQFSLEISSQATFTEGTGIDNYVMRESMYQPPNVTAQYVTNTEENPSGLLHVDRSGALITGTFSDFTVSSYSATYANNCRTVSALTPGGGQFAMTSLAFDPVTTGSTVDRAHVKDFFIVPALIPNSSSYVLSQRSRDSNGACSGTPNTDTIMDNWSTKGFAPWLSSVSGSSADSYISGWTIVGGDIMATKSVQWTSAQGESFSATFTLRHIPDPS